MTIIQFQLKLSLFLTSKLILSNILSISQILRNVNISKSFFPYKSKPFTRLISCTVPAGLYYTQLQSKFRGIPSPKLKTFPLENFKEEIKISNLTIKHPLIK